MAKFALINQKNQREVLGSYTFCLFFFQQLPSIEIKLNSNIINTSIFAVTSSAGTQFLLTFIENYVEADWPAANYSLRLYLSVCGSEKAKVSFYYLSYSNLLSQLCSQGSI